MVTLDEAGRDAPPLRGPPPGSTLARFIEYAWIQSGGSGARTADARRVVPDPSAHLVVAAYVDRPPRVSVVGARTRFCDVDARRSFTVGVRLRPGALPRITGLPASDFTDRAVGIDDVLVGAGAVTEAAAAGEPEACLAEALRLLAGRLRDAPPVDWRVGALEIAWRRPWSAPRVGDLADRLGVAGRTLRATAAAEVGLSPGRWRRVRRALLALERALTGVYAGDRSWSRIAAVSGYHDQPHLTRDFRELLGETPVEFMRRRSHAVPYKTADGGEARMEGHRSSWPPTGNAHAPVP